MSLSFEAIIVLAVILLLIVTLYKEFIRPSIAFLAAIMILLVAGVLNPAETLHGFANEQLWIIILLLILSNTLSKSHIIDQFFKKLLNSDDSQRTFKLKLVGGVGLFSAFLNNTPIVALMMPYVNKWCKDNERSVSQYLIPLSYASILGGCLTLIGTSTNLITNGLAIEYGEESLKIFDFIDVGLPMLILGSGYLLLFGKHVLPHHKSTQEEVAMREYCVETIVTQGSMLTGMTVEKAGLRQLEGLYLIEVIKKDRIVKPVSPDSKIEESDRLIFAGNTQAISDLIQQEIGLKLPEPSTLPAFDAESIVEVVISYNSTLIDQRVQDSNFRSLFNGAIIAIHRNGERLSGKIGDIKLQPGDMLMVLAGGDFLDRVVKSKDFYLVSKVKEMDEEVKAGSIVLFLGLLASVVLAVFEIVPLFTSVAFLVIASIVFRIQKLTELRTKVDFDLIIIIAMGLALGKAMINSGLADQLANGVSSVLLPAGGIALLAGIFIITNLLTAFMTSKAAVAIVLPVALSIAHAQGTPVQAMILIVAYGGAASFITPIGYQTNLMVYGPGGYRFKDFMRAGLPITILYGIVAVGILAYVYNL